DPDDAVQFGLMTNDAFEVGPVPFERYPGGDAGGAGVALDTASELQGFAYAVSTYDVGGCAIEVGRMQQGGALIGDPARFVDGDCTPEVSVAWTGQGIGVAWTQSDPNMDQSAVAFGRTANFSVAIRGYVTVAASGRSPSLAWTGNQFGVLYISTGVVNNLEFRTIFNNQQVGNPVVITRGADHPELRYVPALGQFVAVWTEPALQGARLLKAAFLTPAGEVVQAVTLSSGRNAPVNPTLSPVENLARNAPVTRIAVTYADDGVLFTTWLLWDGRGWAWNGAAEQITGARDPTASLPKAGYASDGAGHGVAYLADSGNGRPQVRLVGGNLGCGVLPADAPR
ncbi:MAG: hypothetical protein KC620_22545, partial [Myxococcales bacterium]|nr:hypothetical protein [Myxococcales bacterium]